jgi:hydrogenase expression/formation protein HypC
MCVAVPGRVSDISEQDGVRVARVDVAGTVRQASLILLPEITVGDWVIVHLGMALRRLDPEAAAETLQLLTDAGVLPGDGR